MRNGNFLKMPVGEIRVKRIRVNQGLGVILLQKQFHTIVHSGLEGEKEICISAASDLAL
jgi:hypothetical protein